MYFRSLVLYEENTPRTSMDTGDSIDVIICINKEEKQLFDNLDQFLNQSYPDINLFLVCDNLPQNTRLKLDKMAQNYSRLVLLDGPSKIMEGKKASITRALRESHDAHLLLSDGDCFPASRSWATLMHNAAVMQNADIVVGYSPYLRESRSILGLWIEYETALTAVLYFSAALRDQAYMSVGRNIYYRKKILNEQLLMRHKDLLSGDDDLTLSHLASSHRVGVCLSPESFVFSFPARTLRAYIRQKTRHFSTAHRYSHVQKLIPGLFALSHMLFYFSLGILFFISPAAASGIYIFRLALVVPFSRSLFGKLQYYPHWFQFVLLDVLQVIFYVFFAPAVFFPKKERW